MCDPKMGFLSVASASTAKDDSVRAGSSPSVGLMAISSRALYC
jgi:hypothetical protein